MRRGWRRIPRAQSTARTSCFGERDGGLHCVMESPVKRGADRLPAARGEHLFPRHGVGIERHAQGAATGRVAALDRLGGERGRSGERHRGAEQKERSGARITERHPAVPGAVLVTPGPRTGSRQGIGARLVPYFALIAWISALAISLCDAARSGGRRRGEERPERRCHRARSRRRGEGRESNLGRAGRRARRWDRRTRTRGPSPGPRCARCTASRPGPVAAARPVDRLRLGEDSVEVFSGSAAAACDAASAPNWNGTSVRSRPRRPARWGAQIGTDDERRREIGRGVLDREVHLAVREERDQRHVDHADQHALAGGRGIVDRIEHRVVAGRRTASVGDLGRIAAIRGVVAAPSTSLLPIQTVTKVGLARSIA